MISQTLFSLISFSHLVPFSINLVFFSKPFQQPEVFVPSTWITLKDFSCFIFTFPNSIFKARVPPVLEFFADVVKKTKTEVGALLTVSLSLNFLHDDFSFYLAALTFSLPLCFTLTLSHTISVSVSRGSWSRTALLFLPKDLQKEERGTSPLSNHTVSLPLSFSLTLLSVLTSFDSPDSIKSVRTKGRKLDFSRAEKEKKLRCKPSCNHFQLCGKRGKWNFFFFNRNGVPLLLAGGTAKKKGKNLLYSIMTMVIVSFPNLPLNYLSLSTSNRSL